MKDRDLVRLYWPVELRPAFDALFDIDEAMRDVVVRATQPALAAIKLAWWRERLEELDDGRVPAEPRLQAAARELLPRGVRGAELARLEAGWAAVIEERPKLDVALDRGEALFELAAALLHPALPAAVATSGRLFAAGQLRRIGLLPEGFAAGGRSLTLPRRLRPLGVMAVLARRDLRRIEAEGSPGRAWAMLRHRLTGRI